MDIRESAQRWAATWAAAWPAKDAAAIVALQAPGCDHYASMFRQYQGAAGLRQYLEECFGEETRPARTWFAPAKVDGDHASVEYWAVIQLADGPTTISGCTVLRFDDEGLVTEARDYSHVRAGHHPPPSKVFDAHAMTGLSPSAAADG